MNRLFILGTGNGAAINCYNTCFILENNNHYLLVDTGGGNGILRQLQMINMDIKNLHDVFISHTHTDHILGIFWIIREVGRLIRDNNYDGDLRIYGNDKVIEAIRNVSKYILHDRFTILLDNQIKLITISDNEDKEIIDLHIQFFDIKAKGDKQFGLDINLPHNKRLVFLGDEPFNKELSNRIINCDYVMHEAFCLDSEEYIFHAYEKNHSTVKNACQIAQSLNIKNIILYHTEDKNLDTRKKLYTAEGQKYYNGNIIVPNDLEIIEL